MNQMAQGGLAGGVATLVMTGVILTGQRVFRFRTAPPRQVTTTALRRIGLARPPSGPAMPAAWIAAHEAYGMGCGIAYVMVRPLLPPSRSVAGLAFGGLVWAIGYLGYLPALGLYPSPDDDTRRRASVMIAAHAVFGMVLAEVEHRLDRSA
jgi:hypothetical protein